jgi:hypothetical protein
VASLPSSLPVVVVKHLSENDPAGVWAVSLAYPAFLNGSTPWSAEINQQIADIQRAEADHYEQGPAAARQAPGRTNHLTGTFGTELLTPSLASFTVIWSDDTTPGQTDLTVSTLTFDLSTGRPIVFDDMFADPDAALGIISVKAADLLYYQLGAAWDEALAQAGTTPNHANFANWSLTREGIKFIFNQYQVVNSEQIPSVVVPWADLMPVLSSRGAVAVYTGATALGSSPSPSSSVAASAGPSPSPSPTPSATDTASPSLPPVS